MPDFSEIKFKQLLPEQQDILIAELSAAGFSGFEEDNDCLIGYIESENLDRKLLAGIISRHQLIFEERTIPEQNWNRSSRGAICG